MTKRRWSEAETLKLRAYAETKYAHQIAELLGRTKASIDMKARRMRIRLRSIQWSAEEELRLRRLLRNMSQSKAALLLGRPIGGIRHKAKRAGLPANRVSVRGETHYMARHSDEQVAECFGLYWKHNWGLVRLAEKYGTSPGTIYNWINRRARKDATKDIAR